MSLMVDCPQPHRVAISCWVNPADINFEMIFDQSMPRILSEYRFFVKRHSVLTNRYNDYMEDIERTPFGRRLFSARVDAGFSQEAAAKAVGMKSQGTLSEAEISGKRSGFTPQLAKLYNVNADWLATGKGSKDIEAQPVLQPVRDPTLDDLDKLPRHEADIFRIQIKAAADIQRVKQRVAQEVGQQQDQDRRKCDDPPPIERRRTSR